MNIAMLSAFVLYFGILFTIALSFYKRAQTSGAFLLGNRGLNYWVTAISTQASDMGAWLFIAYPLEVYTRGLSQVWTAVGLLVFMALNWLVVAPRLRTLTAKFNSLTLWSYFTSRFNDPSSRLRITGTLFSIFFFVIYVATGLIGLSRVLEVDFGVVHSTGLVIGAFIAGSYILIGGFLAAAWCNLFKGIFLFADNTIVPILAFFKTGGVTAIASAAHAHGVSLSPFPSLTVALSLALGWGLGYFGQPHILINFMSIDDVNNFKKAQRVGLVWQIIVLIASICVGLVALAFFTSPIDNLEHLYLLMVRALFSPFFVGFVSCGMLASIISTASLQVLVTAGALSQDIYKTIINTHATSEQVTRITRIAIILLIAASTLLAYTSGASIYKLVLYAWSGLGCSFGPLVLLSLYSTYINRHGALAAMISGGLSAGLLPLVTTVPALIPGFVISTVCAYVVSYLTKTYSSDSCSASTLL